jgi:glucan phosphoethanolaminetransferase (alkaline phosphatase superfamily)
MYRVYQYHLDFIKRITINISISIYFYFTPLFFLVQKYIIIIGILTLFLFFLTAYILTYNIFINPDMRSNLRRAWANFSQEWIDECPKNIPQLKGCLFTLCFYHALVQGRRRFGQQGWSKKYSFNVGDLTVCAQVLKTWIGRSTYVYQKKCCSCCTKVLKKK